MSNDYQPGAAMVARQDILYGNQIAFVSGEQMVLQRIEPDPNTPDYKYIVYSSRVQQYMQLSDKEIKPMSQGAVAGQDAGPIYVPPPVQYQYPQSELPPVQRPRNTALIIALSVIGGLILLGIVVLGVTLNISNQNKASTNAQRRTCQANLRTIDGAIMTYDAEYEAFPPDGEVGDMLVPEFLKRTPTCPTSGKTYTIVPGPTESDPPTVTCPTNVPGHSI